MCWVSDRGGYRSRMTLTLRPYRPEDLPLPGSDSEYDDFGPRQEVTVPPDCALDRDGHLAIVVDDEVIGDVGWHWVFYGPGTASRCPMMGISIGPSHRGQGHGTTAQRLLVDLLFAGTPVNRVEASTDVENVAEQRSLEKAGLSREGVARGAQWRRGAFHDLVTYAILRAEWEAAR
jgi:RimJ/RimL family protein N-acetyltransferase